MPTALKLVAYWGRTEVIGAQSERRIDPSDIGRDRSVELKVTSGYRRSQCDRWTEERAEFNGEQTGYDSYRRCRLGGCVLANRLTEDKGARVLLVEAAGSDRHPYIQIPLGVVNCNSTVCSIFPQDSAQQSY